MLKYNLTITLGMSQLINYLLAVCVIFSAYYVGIFLASLVPEELKQYKRTIAFGRRWSLLKYYKTRNVIAGAVLALSSSQINYLISVGILLFLYHMKLGVFYYTGNAKKNYAGITGENILFLIVAVMGYGLVIGVK